MAIFRYNNINIYYTISGTGSAVVLLHGFLENTSMWKDIIPVLNKRNKVIAIDLLGHGKTENLGYIHTMEEQAKMVEQLLTSLRLRKFTLIGHSMGGYVGLSFAKFFPEKTKGLCLMNSTAYPDTEEKKENRKRAIAVVKNNYKSFVKISIPQLFSDDDRNELKNEINKVIEEALTTSKQGIIAALEGMRIREDRRDVLNNKGIKKLLILGETDPVLNLNGHKKQVENNDTLLITMAHGHMSHIENKTLLISTLKKFVN